jgi:hypothetical protein
MLHVAPIIQEDSFAVDHKSIYRYLTSKSLAQQQTPLSSLYYLIHMGLLIWSHSVIPSLNRTLLKPPVLEPLRSSVGVINDIWDQVATPSEQAVEAVECCHMRWIND